MIQVPQFQGYFGIIDSDKLEQSNYYVYFIKKANCSVPNFSNMDETNLKMPTYFTIGSLTGNIFENLEKILDLVILL